MDKQRFEFLARRLRSKEPVVSAARLVLLHAVPAADACRTIDVSPASLSRSLKSFRELDAEIKKVYGVVEKSS